MALQSITADSRRVTRGSLFVAVTGNEADGHTFIDDAVTRGAAALVVEKAPGGAVGIPVVQVSDSRLALAMLSHTMAGSPSDKLRIVGVTGTNGKTTTAWLIHHLLMRAGRETGLLGTIESRFGSTRIDASLTTPGPVELSDFLSQMVDAGCTDCVMEVSSHALDQDRVAGIRYSAAVFTNLTRDHLDYHGTFDAYLTSKKKLFDSLEPDAPAVYNADDASAESVVADVVGPRYSYGMSSTADYSFRILDSGLRGLRLQLDGEERSFNLVGEFNAYNLSAAYGVGRALGFDRALVLDALADASPVPGRLEQIALPNDVTAIVDYAHTPDALENVLEAVRAASPAGSAIWCIFGCGGDRDRGKRPLMGGIAERLADYVVVTNDNPRTESPEAILRDIRPGMKRPDDAAWFVDRRDAIRYVAGQINPGETVVITGKGHETYQIIGRERIHFDDREEVRRWFV